MSKGRYPDVVRKNRIKRTINVEKLVVSVLPERDFQLEMRYIALLVQSAKL